MKKKSNLAMGLNSRGGGKDGTTAVRSSRLPKSVFDEDNDDDDDNSDNETHTASLSGREAVNRSIAKQQAAIRAQASAALATADVSIYDYDGMYDAEHTTTTNRNTVAATDTTTTDSRKSRYIEDLMKTAKIRKMERDIAYDRKVARDQRAEEEAQPEYRNKEKFITSSYQRQLEERHQYEQNESKRQTLEAENDVTKRSDGGFGIARFYGNLSKETRSTTNDDNGKHVASRSSDDRIHKNDNHESTRINETATNHLTQQRNASTNEEPKDGIITPPKTNMRLAREQKVQAARDRYFQRHNNNIPTPIVSLE